MAGGIKNNKTIDTLVRRVSKRSLPLPSTLSPITYRPHARCETDTDKKKEEIKVNIA